MPTVIGKMQAEAEAILRTRGSRWRSSRCPTTPPGTVLEQDPPAGHERRQGLDGDDHGLQRAGDGGGAGRRRRSRRSRRVKTLREPGLRPKVRKRSVSHGEGRPRDRHGPGRRVPSWSAAGAITLPSRAVPRPVQVPSVIGSQQDAADTADPRRGPDPRLRESRLRRARWAGDRPGPRRGQHGEASTRRSPWSSRTARARRWCRTWSASRRTQAKGDLKAAGLERSDRQADDHGRERGRPGPRSIAQRRHAPAPRRVRDDLRRQVHGARRPPPRRRPPPPPRRPDAGRGAQRRSLERARGLARLGRLGGRGPAGRRATR